MAQSAITDDNKSLINGFQIEAHRPEAVVAGNHRALGVLHPAVVEVPAACGKLSHETFHGAPGAFTEIRRPLTVFGNEDLPLGQLAGMLDGVFISFHEVLVADLADNSDPYR